jgi:hypothetical protein
MDSFYGLDGCVEGSCIVTVGCADVIGTKERDEQFEFATVGKSSDGGRNHGGIDRGGARGSEREQERAGVWEDSIETSLGIEEVKEAVKGMAAEGRTCSGSKYSGHTGRKEIFYGVGGTSSG